MQCSNTFQKTQINCERIHPSISNSFRYLGCTISSYMKQNGHIQKYVIRQTRPVDFLKVTSISATPLQRKLPTNLKLDTHSSLHAQSRNRSNRENKICLTWYKEQEQSCLQIIQYYSTPCVSYMVNQIEWEPFGDQKEVTRLAMIYKHASGNVNVDQSQFQTYNYIALESTVSKYHRSEQNVRN